MNWVGSSIIARSKALRPLAKTMLDCALTQSYTEAYDALGRLADMEGHGVDAYRLWEKGTNQGCEACTKQLEDLGKTKSDFIATPLEKAMPDLARLEGFYANNQDYELTGLPEFRRRPPPELAYHIRDDDLLAWLRLQQRIRASDLAP